MTELARILISCLVGAFAFVIFLTVGLELLSSVREEYKHWERLERR